ncbi:MAG: oleate hydratase [Eggerthellaceae bacterium]
MRIYDLKYNAKAPEGIEERRAYIIGSGMAGLSAAAYLVDDIHMPGENVHVLEASEDIGGSMDGTGTYSDGYLCRGERELEPNMECLWDLCSRIPSLRNPGRTVLDEVWEFNYKYPLHNEYRLVVKGKPIDCHDFSMDEECTEAMMRILFCDETELEGKAIEDVFPASFFRTNLWQTFHNMLAFKTYHSAIEAKRYFRRFTHFMPESDYEHGILHTDMNEYDAIIRPMIAWLEGKGVRIVRGCKVKEILMNADDTVAEGIRVVRSGKEETIEVGRQNMVFFTNGSMVTNSSFGDNVTVAKTDRRTDDRGLFTVWEKLAARNEKFGRPETFISDIDRTKWMSFFPTITDFPEFYRRIEEASGRSIGTNGVITFPESNWDISYIAYHNPYFPDQPENVQVGWGYGLWGERPGNYVAKPMCECTGNEILLELLYHFDMLDLYDGMVRSTYMSTCMMPYITSQFMPRRRSDRPKVVPEGCENLAFIGQYVETPEDAVFTVETSCRTGLYAAYALTGVEKKPLEVASTFYDIRYVIAQVKKIQGIEGDLTMRDVPKVNPVKLPEMASFALKTINSIERYPSLYPGKEPPQGF